jgi:hypothetical protein
MAVVQEEMSMFEGQRPMLRIPSRESVGACINFSTFPCLCVVARDGWGAVTGVGCCTDEHANMLRSLLAPGAFVSRHPRGFSKLAPVTKGKWRSARKKDPLWATVLRLTEGGLAEPHVLVPVSLLEKAMDALQASQEHAGRGEGQ